MQTVQTNTPNRKQNYQLTKYLGLLVIKKNLPYQIIKISNTQRWQKCKLNADLLGKMFNDEFFAKQCDNTHL